jgi:hypothetical protein
MPWNVSPPLWRSGSFSEGHGPWVPLLSSPHHSMMQFIDPTSLGSFLDQGLQHLHLCISQSLAQCPRPRRNSVNVDKWVNKRMTTAQCLVHHRWPINIGEMELNWKCKSQKQGQRESRRRGWVVELSSDSKKIKDGEYWKKKKENTGFDKRELHVKS